MTPSAEGNGSDTLDVLGFFDRERFSARLSELIHQTHGYGGTLLGAGSAIREAPESPRPEAAPDGLVPPSLRKAIDGVLNSGVQSAAIEAGHVYNYESLDDPALLASLEEQFRQASLAEAHLAGRGIAVRKLLFIDDYNPHPESGELECNLDEEQYFKLARELGFEPFDVVYEGDMAPLAQAMIDHLTEVQGLTHLDEANGEVRILLNRRNIELKRGDKISCAALDAAFCLVKYAFVAESSVNVLPRSPHTAQSETEAFSYGGQQRKTRDILYDHLNVRTLPFFNVFVSNEGRHSSGSHHTLRKRR